MSEKVRPQVGDKVEITVKGTVTNVSTNVVTRIVLSVDGGEDVVGVSYNSSNPEAVPEITVLGHVYQPGDVADITKHSGEVVRGMYIRSWTDSDEGWMTSNGTILRNVVPDRIKLVRAAWED
jgi:hypothetical protein